MKYKIAKGSERDGITTYLVTDMSQPPLWGNYRESVGVWVSDAGIRCCQCSTMMTAMLSSCPHANAVRRRLKKEQTAIR